MSLHRLHFVYNVDATPQALVADFIHRLRDPATYPCRLCDLTYGRLIKKPSWIRFLATLPVRSQFYTRDRFLKRHPGVTADFPIVLAETAAGEFETFLSSAELARLQTLEALKEVVLARIQTQGRRKKVTSRPRTAAPKPTKKKKPARRATRT